MIAVFSKKNLLTVIIVCVSLLFSTELYFSETATSKAAVAESTRIKLEGSVPTRLAQFYRVPLYTEYTGLSFKLRTFLSYSKNSTFLKLLVAIGYRPTAADLVETAYDVLSSFYNARFGVYSMCTIYPILFKEIENAELAARAPDADYITTNSLVDGIKRVSEGIYIVTIDNQAAIQELSETTGLGREQLLNALEILQLNNIDNTQSLQAPEQQVIMLGLVNYVIKNNVRVEDPRAIRHIEQHIPLTDATNIYVVTFAYEALVSHFSEIWIYFFRNLKPTIEAVGRLTPAMNPQNPNKTEITDLIKFSNLLELNNGQLATILTTMASINNPALVNFSEVVRY